MRWFTAQDTFNADLEGGGTRTITRGTTLPESDAVVQQIGEGPLFKLQAAEEEEAAPAPAPKPRAPRAPKGGTP